MAIAQATATAADDAVVTQQWRQWIDGQRGIGRDTESIVQDMVTQGWTRDDATAIVYTQPPPQQARPTPQNADTLAYYNAQADHQARLQQAAAARRARSSSAGRNMLIGGGICLLGLVITIGTYSAASESGGHYTIAWGAIVFGAIQFFKGMASLGGE